MFDNLFGREVVVSGDMTIDYLVKHTNGSKSSMSATLKFSDNIQYLDSRLVGVFDNTICDKRMRMYIVQNDEGISLAIYEAGGCYIQHKAVGYAPIDVSKLFNFTLDMVDIGSILADEDINTVIWGKLSYSDFVGMLGNTSWVDLSEDLGDMSVELVFNPKTGRLLKFNATNIHRVEGISQFKFGFTINSLNETKVELPGMCKLYMS